MNIVKAQLLAIKRDCNRLRIYIRQMDLNQQTPYPRSPNRVAYSAALMSACRHPINLSDPITTASIVLRTMADPRETIDTSSYSF